jgi:methylmalonyl-CoA mutase
MILAFFMNAIDQNVEKFITENNLWNKVEEKLKEKFDDKGLKRPVYHGNLPESNNGLGLKLGLTGDEILDAETYKK